MDSIIAFLDSVGDNICPTGIHRPIVEHTQDPISRAENSASFDEAVRVLSMKARKHSSEEDESDRREVWKVTLGECDKELCVGPLTRHEVEELFKGSPLGPRCIPAFGIWQKGKLRRVDDACRSKHNAITRMWETIACCGADLPARIAAEFAKHISVDKLFLRLGTDDIASAYRILVSARPEYNVAAVWKPASLCEDSAGKVCYFALRGFNFGLKCAPGLVPRAVRSLRRA